MKSTRCRLTYQLIWVVGTFLLGAWSGICSAAIETYLQIDGIDGESEVKIENAGSIPMGVVAWNLGVRPTEGNTGVACFKDLSITKWVDKSSPQLILNAVLQKPFTSGTLYVVNKKGDATDTYLEIVMEKVLVSSISTGGSGDRDRQTETVKLMFDEAQFTYWPQYKDGSLGAPYTVVIPGTISCN